MNAYILYDIYVTTSNIRGAGTDANVFIQIFGKRADTGEILLKNSTTNKNPFEQGKTDHFSVRAKDVGSIQKIRIGHDNSKFAAGWHLDKVVIKVNETRRSYMFTCNKWFDKGEGDGKIERDLYPTNNNEIENNRRTPDKMSNSILYSVQVCTSDIPNASTGANVYIQIFGSKGLQTGEIPLKNSINNKRPFLAGQVDVFEFKLENLGKIKKIKIGHDGVKANDGWHLNYVVIEAPELGRSWVFDCNQWLDIRKEDGLIERVLYPREDDQPFGDMKKNKNRSGSIGNSTTVYIVHVNTSDIAFAGTNAKVYLQIFGQDGLDTGKIQLKNSKTYKDPFEQGHTDTFEIQALDVGDIRQIKIGHDNSKPLAGWHLKSVVIETPIHRKIWKFPCNKWLDKTKDDGKIERELFPIESSESRSKSPSRSISHSQSPSRSRSHSPHQSLENTVYVIEIATSNVKFAGTDANVFIQLFSKKYHTEKILLKKSLTYKNPFEQGQVDRFEVKTLNVGEIEKIRIGHDNSNIMPGWHLDYVKINSPEFQKEWLFPCNMWFDRKKDDGQIERDLLPTGEMLHYEVFVTTSDIRDAGTDSNVYMQIFGKKGESSVIKLKNSKMHVNKFERGETDRFEIKLPDLGELYKLRIGHDNSGVGPAWHLANVVIDCAEKSKRWNFVCNRWLAKDGNNDHTEIELAPGDMDAGNYVPTLQYTVDVYTGDESKAGTDANVFIKIYGENGNSGEKELKTSKSHRNKFERNQMDRFIIETADLGVLHKVKIRHDNTGVLPAWFLDRIEITRGRRHYVFLCGKWLATDKDDGQIERVLFEKDYKEPTTKDKESGKKKKKPTKRPVIPQKKLYYVEIHTGSKPDSSYCIDANVYLKIFGDNGETEEKKLVKSHSHDRKFEKNRIDVFVVEANHLGTLYAVKIRHDNSGALNDWFLEHIVISEDDKNEFKYKFMCKNWLSSNKKDCQIERTLLENNALEQFETYGC